MKRVLITGSNSYVGTNVEKWLTKESDKYFVETLDMKDPNWKNFDFSRFDVVFHVAGIAHVTTKKSMKEAYFKVNRDLAIETAKISKDSGIKQFIFMSSMIVYSSKETRITNLTKPNPDNFYGLSKLQAESALINLGDDSFIVTILRPPMIYGKGSKGNFFKLANFVKYIHIFPNSGNQKSILYIDNLAIIVKNVIDELQSGIIFPRNTVNISTFNLVKTISKYMNIKIKEIKLMNFLIKKLLLIKRIKKIWGDFYYDSLDERLKDLDLVEFDSSISTTII